VKLTLSVDEQLVERIRKRAESLSKTLNQLIRNYLLKSAGNDDPERSIQEFRQLSAKGHAQGWRFKRDELHERS
jgi:hypothetical protein